MMRYYGNSLMNGYGFHPDFAMFGAAFAFLLIPLMIWSIFWKGWALWKAARAEDKVWFIILLVVNTVGILEIIYIFLVNKQAKKSPKKK